MKILGKSELELLGFALCNCVVEVDPGATKYLRAVHRTALELAVPNHFGVDVGGFWLLSDQIALLRKLPQYYSSEEAAKVAVVVEAYLNAQFENWRLL